MERSQLLKTGTPRWVQLFETSDFEAELVPGRLPSLSMAQVTGVWTPQIEREVCTKAFIGFRNLMDDGTPVANTLEERLTLFRVSHIRDAIIGHCNVANNEASQGEGPAASV